MQGRRSSFTLTELWRKSLIMPAEHGSWAWLLVPFGVGTAVSQTFNLATLLTLLAALSVFLLRQPVTVWLRVRRGKARRADAPLAMVWIILLVGTAVTCGLTLLLSGFTALLWLALPLLLIFAFYLGAARYGRASLRSLGMEVSGAAALALSAPAAYLAGTGQYGAPAAALWLLLAVQNVLGALYVRVRIADTHHRPVHRQGMVIAHLLGLLLILALGLVKWLPLWAFVPFALVFIRAVWAARQPRPVPNVKRFGCLEMGVEIACGLWIAAIYLI